MVENFPTGSGYIIAKHMYPDDMPTGTLWDLYDLFVELRDDDLGYDNDSYVVNVSSVAPTIEEGKTLPDITTISIDEGTEVYLDKFAFDDVAFDEPTEKFEYQVDWGDGTVTPWMDDFRYPGDTGYGGGKVANILIVDDAALMRQMLRDMLADTDFEVIGEVLLAMNSSICLSYSLTASTGHSSR